jgi:amidase
MESTGIMNVIRIDHDAAHAFVPYPPREVPCSPNGELGGMRFGVKDLFHVRGYPTGAGNPLLLAALGIQDRTAPVVQKLLNAGAAFAGKTVTDELAYSINGKNAHFGSPVNGAAPDRVCGGSSSGSASAVSNRLCDFAIGTDTGGSVRVPASHCGLFGLRPTHGRVTLQDCVPLAPSFDTCGWFARDLDTFVRVAGVLLDADSVPLPSVPRLLFPEDLWDLTSPALRAASEDVLRGIEYEFGGFTSVRVSLEDTAAMSMAFRVLQAREAWNSHGNFISRFDPPLGPGVKERFQWARQISAPQVQEAANFRSRFRTHLSVLLGSDGVLVLPTMPDVAPRNDEPEQALEAYRDKAMRLLCSAGLSGFPQLTLPIAQSLGAPFGVSLLGPAGTDNGLLQIARRLRSSPATKRGHRSGPSLEKPSAR